MNGRKAKALRRQAQELTIGMPKAQYMPYAVPRFSVDILGNKFKTKGKPLLMAHACTRNIYKLLKGQGNINISVIPEETDLLGG